MKCPKCGYLGFETVERCRNCGYDFSLAAEPPVPDLPIRRSAAAPTLLDDLTLTDRNAPSADDRRFELETRADLDRLFGTPEPRGQRRAAAAEPEPPEAELPLFVGAAAADDQPLITKISAPRTPLSVRTRNSGSAEAQS